MNEPSAHGQILDPDVSEEELGLELDGGIPTQGYQRSRVVGLGGSAGSIQALQRFFEAMPETSGMAFVVVLHLSPEHQSLLSESAEHDLARRGRGPQGGRARSAATAAAVGDGSRGRAEPNLARAA